MKRMTATRLPFPACARGALASVLVLAACAACAGSPAPAGPGAPETPVTGGSATEAGAFDRRYPAPPRTDLGTMAFTTTGMAEFDTWRTGFAARAEAQGRHPGVIYALLEGIEPHPAFLAAQTVQPAADISSQAEFAKPIWDYLRTAVSESRIRNGRSKSEQVATFMADMETRYRVDSEVVAAIWGMETSYGGFIGTDDAAETLASMAVEGRRRSFAEGELIALMKIVENGQAERDELISGWAGAMGQTQFMPSTFFAYAVDHDADGKKDVWRNTEDALGSAANYLAVSGYRFDEPWGLEVAVPVGFDFSLADGQDRRVSTWASSGVTLINGAPLETGTAEFAELWLPAGATGPKLLLFKNFDVFKTYNRADSYALAVGLLSDAIAGRPALQTPWPTGLRPLTVADIRTLQQALTDLGYDTQGVDGIAGRNTRRALQRFQADRNIPADGYPTQEALTLVLAAQG